jgi:predicted dehydrogenase
MPEPAARPLTLGILGAANIARAFIAAVRGSPKVDVAAVASRDPARAAAFARDNGVARVHATYDALLADPAIEAVYVPLANTLHAQWAIRTVEAGKHVLCEKPLAVSADEARAMIAAARRQGVHLVEAYPYRAQPQMAKLRELLAEGAIGRLRTAQASFGFPLSDPANIRMDTALAGGARMDAGSYPVSFLRMVACRRFRGWGPPASI